MYYVKRDNTRLVGIADGGMGVRRKNLTRLIDIKKKDDIISLI